MSPAKRIAQLLADKPGLKTQQIATELGLDKSEVAEALYGSTEAEIVQDSSYRWWPRTRDRLAGETSALRHKLLGQLCRYYLDCLSREGGAGFSIPAAAEQQEYVSLGELPFTRPLAVSVHATSPADRAARRMVQKVRREPGQLALYVGYGVRVRSFHSRDQDETRLEPVLLYPIEETEEHSEILRPASGIPQFNPEVLKNLPSIDSGNLIDEAIQLSEELGLANSDDDLPQWDEIIFRLQHRRPDWDWKEELNPYRLSQGVRLADLTAHGIYNRAILFAGTRSPFTYGLENELRKLAQCDEDAVQDTALGLWLRGGGTETAPPEDRPILEIVPLNSEQRQAVVQGLGAPLTVVTGPPGTGKSQVVTSLLINQAFHGASVLFSSRNNHAVTVVESRVNDLGPTPLLLRLGKEEHHAQLAQHLTATLAESSSADDTTGYEWQKEAYDEMRTRYAAVQAQIAEVVSLRNRVDELERAAEPARTLFQGDAFTALRALDTAAVRRRIETLSEALEAAKEETQPAMVRMVWSSVKPRRLQRVADVMEELSPDAAKLCVPPQDDGANFYRTLADRLEWATGVQTYLQALYQLRAGPSLETLARELSRIAEDSAHNSVELWQSWLRLRPGRWKPEQRKLLGEYVSLLQMIAGGDRYDEGAGRKVFRRYYSLFPKVAKVLPCWAVTSLSARGRLPFEPGLFDLVVIDEASQCDIASAFPLLYRAKRAVIIGDPLQLKHVSTVVPQQDRLMQAAHGLADGGGTWAYSVNSLFDLARSLCRHEDLVNLRDHHRSHRDIIAFSNQHFYRGRLRVVTDHETLNRPAADGRNAGAAVRWVDVKGKVVRPSAGGAINSQEAEAVIAALRRLVVEEGYAGTLGVVTPFRAQANRIRALVHQDRDLSQRLGPLQFVVDTVHGFQGDERDVIFFSAVVSQGIGDSAIRFLKGNGNLFNVAITRARSELVVVGDRQAAIHSDVSYLAGFAEYTQDLAEREPSPQASFELGAEYPIVAHPELVSDWERVFYKAMYAAGLRAVPQYEEAPYILDFALFDGERKLNIEIDGENYHRHWNGELCRRDQIRSRRLGDLGWDILRLWVYEVRDDLEGSVRRVGDWMARKQSGTQGTG